MKKYIIVVFILLIVLIGILIILNNSKSNNANKVGIEKYLYEKFGNNYIILENAHYGGGEGELRGNIYYISYNNQNHIVYTVERLFKETEYFSYNFNLEETNDYLYCNPPENYAIMIVNGSLNKNIDVIATKIKTDNVSNLFVYSFNNTDIHSNYFRLVAASGTKISSYDINETNKIYQKLNYSQYSFNNSNKNNLSLNDYLISNIKNY